MDIISSFEESNYDLEDWLPVLKPFDNHSRLESQGAFKHEQDRLREDPEKLTDKARRVLSETEIEQELNSTEKHELSSTYKVTDTPGRIHTWYSPQARSEGSMLEGFLEFPLDFTGDQIRDVQERIVEEYGTSYMEFNGEIGPNDSFTLATLNIPEEYDPETIEETVQAIVDIYDENQRLQDEVRHTVENYEIQ